jgi:cell division protein FtsX
MNTFLFALILVLAMLATLVLTGWIFYLLVQRYFDNIQKERLLQMKIDERRETLKVVTPIRLQAYERMALFLERISPDSLVLRCYQPGMDLRLLQGVMTKNIRNEWEHNLSQQVYLSDNAWMRIREAKDEMINMVNSSAVTLSDTTDPTRLAATIFAAAAEHLPTDQAREALHKEIAQLTGSDE